MARDMSQSPLVKAARRKSQKAPGALGSMAIGFSQGMNQGMQQGMQFGIARAMENIEQDKSDRSKIAQKFFNQANQFDDPEAISSARNAGMAILMGDITQNEGWEVLKPFMKPENYPQPTPVAPPPVTATTKITESEWQQKVAKRMEPQRKFSEKEYGRLAAKKRGQTSFSFEGIVIPIKMGEWTDEDQKNLEFYATQLQEFGIATTEIPELIEPPPSGEELPGDLDKILEDLRRHRKPASIFQQSGMMTPGGLRRAGRKPVG